MPIYNSATKIWNLRGNQIDGESVGDQAGAAVALAGEGNVVTVGAYANDGGENIINAHRCGQSTHFVAC